MDQPYTTSLQATGRKALENTRPTPLLEDSEATRQKLEAWLSEHHGNAISIPELTIPEATGMSNVTLLFDMVWNDGGQQRREPVVARLQPDVERPIFPSYDLSLQYSVMDAVGRHSDIPVPELLGLETDKTLLGVQFYFMKRVDGRIPPDMPPYNMDGWMMHEATAEQRADLWFAAVDTMARFHRLDYRELGMDRLEEAGKTPLQQQLAYWEAYYSWALEGRDHPVGREALNWLHDNQPAEETTALCWGDSRLGNMIIAESLDAVAAVLDWEMAVLGNPLQDIAWFNFLDATFAEGLGMPRLEGLPSYEDTVAHWAQISGCSTEHYDYYLIFAGMRYSLIMSRVMLATDQGDSAQDNFVTQLLTKHLNTLR